MTDDFFSTIRRSLSTRRSRHKQRPSISSLSAVSSDDSSSDTMSALRISPPISPPVTPPREEDMLLAGEVFNPRPAPAPPTGAGWSKHSRVSFASSTHSGTMTPPEIRHTPPPQPPGGTTGLGSPAHIGRSPVSKGYTSSMRHPTPPPPPRPRTGAMRASGVPSATTPRQPAGAVAAAAWRTHLLTMAKSYASITSAEADFDPATTQRAHFQAVVNRLSDPELTELQGLAVLRAYIDQIHSSTRDRARVARRFIPE